MKWEKKDFGVKKGPKRDLLELLRTFSRYFRNNAKRSLKRVFALSHTTTVRMFIVEGHNKKKVW